MKTFSKTPRLLVGAVAMVTFAVMAAVPASAAHTSNNLNAGQKVKYVALGDSYAYGVGANDPATESYPADLDAARADIVLTANLAEPGATMSDVINVRPLPEALRAREVGDVAAFLGSPLASGITGCVIHVDKGYHAMGKAIAL